MIYTSLPICLLVIGAAVSSADDSGVDKRAYSYVSEYKRLPVYNFGLGKSNELLETRDGRTDFDLYLYDKNQTKDSDDQYQNIEQNMIDSAEKRPHEAPWPNDRKTRYWWTKFWIHNPSAEGPISLWGDAIGSRPYSFGLGKRSLSDEGTLEQYPNDIDRDALAEIYDQYDDLQGYEKRARPYSFGLGKRFDQDDDTTEEKRARTYDFGLGKRLPLYNFGLGKRARNYNFGLGKRLSSKFNFGLGKRERDMHRFNFGLGKRSDDTVEEVNYSTE